MYPSATTKALHKMQPSDERGETWIRGTSKYSSSIQKRIINHNLSKVLKPKNAVSILQELKPGSSFKIIQSVKGNSPLFIAYVEHSNSIIATGEGTSKSEAKNVAAENVLKTILTETLSDNPMNQFSGNGAGLDIQYNSDAYSNLPWLELASLGIYKMFSSWKNECETKVEQKYVPSQSGMVPPQKKKNQWKEKKDLPPNALDIHPSTLLNFMMPGLQSAAEIRRDPGPAGLVTMGFDINGVIYTGKAHSKKDARKEAAKTVLFKFYGMVYPHDGEHM